jgi:hypothetical protein
VRLAVQRGGIPLQEYFKSFRPQHNAGEQTQINDNKNKKNIKFQICSQRYTAARIKSTSYHFIFHKFDQESILISFR